MLILILITIFTVFAVKQLTTSKVLSKDEITTQVEKSFNGEILAIVQNSDHYIASFNKNGSIFEVTVDEEHGKFSNLKLVQKNSEQTSSTQNEQPKPEENLLILTEQQAIELALQEVNGKLDSVDFEKTTDGGNYFIEIEQGDEEIIVQIHAITGKILSIQFDD